MRMRGKKLDREVFRGMSITMQGLAAGEEAEGVTLYVQSPYQGEKVEMAFAFIGWGIHAYSAAWLPH